MTDQPQQPGRPGNSGAWQPVPGGGDYDPDQTMHVSFAAQLPPEPRPGEDPLSAHGPVGDGDPATQWTIPVIREESEGDSGEYSVGAFTSSWDRAPSPAAPTQSFPAGLFRQGASATQAAAANPPAPLPAHAEPAGDPEARWSAFSGGEALPWQPVDQGAAEAAWSAVVDEVPEAGAEPAADRDRDRGHEQDHEPDQGREFASGPEHVSEPGHAAGAEYQPEHTAGTEYEREHTAGADDESGHTAGGDYEHEAGAGYGPGPEAGADYEPERVGGPAYESGFGSEHEPETVAGPEPEHGQQPEDGSEPEAVEETRSEHPLASYMLRVNGTERPVTDAWLGESLLYVLRERLGLAGAKDGCEQGECGACSVQVDGRLVASCLVPAATAAGSEVRTVEGLSGDGRLSDVQQALVECGAVQCGFCIPGMAMTVHDLLEGNHRPTDLEARQALSGNLCRCSGYRGVIEAVRQVVTARDAEDPPPAPRIPNQTGPMPPEAAV
jgi:aerobic-type carbon monoxide dehydrogenase small subunit (CoxS/CutS family)